MLFFGGLNHGRFAATGLFDKPETLERISTRLLTGYVIDAIGQPTSQALPLPLPVPLPLPGSFPGRGTGTGRGTNPIGGPPCPRRAFSYSLPQNLPGIG